MATINYIIIGIALFSNVTVWIIQQQRIKALHERIKLWNAEDVMKFIELRIAQNNLEHNTEINKVLEIVGKALGENIQKSIEEAKRNNLW